ncbi:DUF6118 family protein [Rhizorhabdus dicambivorans]|uniref:Uncharacterized protein n=1 Tax=Rhizorhabdus dicambivorans TaxID=1850238 RepID=A0A2A4FUN0_9SPHN|nr:DUF6118 family protein [Rhizorhabdus dicambivorans]ATE65768.1 hypothetical protein CMV14_16325 [Rhizorhabdus dicambivorans]PCE41148.1 hypothetical protein COO09_16735 [Rhizorhabdus dicambivorans]
MDTDTDDVELPLDLEPEPEPDPATLDTAGDPAAEAFARLEGEMALMRRAVQHLAAERADIVIPDYGATLTDLAKRMGAISESLKGMAGHPAMQMTPDSISQRIVAAAEAARRSDQDRITQARSDLSHAAQEMRSVTAHARTAAEQRQQLNQVAGGALLAGILLWSFLPGTIARAMPESWHWPERMAARMVGASSRWNAGARLMQSDSPEAWNALVQTADIQRDNRDAIDTCRKTAATSQQPVRCSVKIRPSSQEGETAATPAGTAKRSQRGA